MGFLINNALHQRRCVRQRLKKQVREKYRRLKNLVKLKLSSTVTNEVALEIKSSNFDIYGYDYELAMFIIIKKLESKGYMIKYRKGDVNEHKKGNQESTYFRNDRLYISW